MLYYETFNSTFFLVAGFFLALLVIGCLLLRKKDKKTRSTVIIAALVIAFISFWPYKYAISKDTGYTALRLAAGVSTGTFTWWDELPLQLCNINMMIIPIALLTRNRKLLGFGFFTAPIGALMAILMPGIGFSGCSFLLPRMLGYYFTHYMILICAIALGVLDLYRPTFKDVLPASLTILVVTFIIFLFNMTLRWTGIHPYCNYFFTVETEGNALLNLFWSIIPVPFLYILLGFLIFIPYECLMVLLYKFIDRKKAA